MHLAWSYFVSVLQFHHASSTQFCNTTRAIYKSWESDELTVSTHMY